MQLALDVPSLGASANLTAVLRCRLARVEVGTPLLVHSGLAAVEVVRSVAPGGVTVVADTKICDAGRRIASDAFKAGAAVVTVAGAAVDSPTWRGVLDAALAAPEVPGTVMIDTVGWPTREARSGLRSLVQVGQDTGVPVEVCIHRPKQEPAPFSALFQEFAPAGLPADVNYLVAGQMVPGLVAPALIAGFGVVIVGGAVTGAVDPAHVWGILLEEVVTERTRRAAGPQPGTVPRG